MPWTPDDAERHTSTANTPKKKKVWAKVANQVRKQFGNDARAIREANAAIDRIKD